MPWFQPPAEPGGCAPGVWDFGNPMVSVGEDQFLFSKLFSQTPGFWVRCFSGPFSAPGSALGPGTGIFPGPSCSPPNSASNGAFAGSLPFFVFENASNKVFSAQFFPYFFIIVWRAGIARALPRPVYTTISKYLRRVPRVFHRCPCGENEEDCEF